MRRVLLWLAIGMLGAASPAAAAVTLTLYNCTAQNLSLTVYSELDALCGPNFLSNVAKCGAVTLSCGMAKCKVAGLPGLGSTCGNYPLLEGKRVIPKNGKTTYSTVEFNNFRGGAGWALNCVCREDQIPQ